jgi:hypothetical protein
MENFTTQGVQNCPVVRFDPFSCKFTNKYQTMVFSYEIEFKYTRHMI